MRTNVVYYREFMMKKYIAIALSLAAFSVPAFGAGLDSLLSKLNNEARANLSGFSARISAQFGVPEAQVSVVLSTVSKPADAFMVFQLGKMTRQPPDKVLQVYQTEKGRGWGAMAKDLGIKPGSSEFHALKRGDFDLHGSEDDGPGKGKGKGKGKHDD